MLYPKGILYKLCFEKQGQVVNIKIATRYGAIVTFVMVICC